ncbi:MAG: hypothetical protein ACSLE8_22700 [Rhodococcus sp. (in: high G+C Gram-positive bacteria)]
MKTAIVLVAGIALILTAIIAGLLGLGETLPNALVLVVGVVLILTALIGRPLGFGEPMKNALVLVAGMVLIVIAFFAGQVTAPLATKRTVTLKEPMILLDADNKPAGQIPRGAVLYVVHDAFADRSSRFILHVETDVNDEEPLQPSFTKLTWVYGLKSQAWLKAQSAKQ